MGLSVRTGAGGHLVDLGEGNFEPELRAPPLKTPENQKRSMNVDISLYRSKIL